MTTFNGGAGNACVTSESVSSTWFDVDEFFWGFCWLVGVSIVLRIRTRAERVDTGSVFLFRRTGRTICRRLPDNLPVSCYSITATRLRAGLPRNGGLILGKGKIRFLFHRVQTGSGAVAASDFSLEIRRPGLKPASHLHLVPKIRIQGTILHSPNTSVWHDT